MKERKFYMVFFAIVFTVNLVVNLYIFFRTRGIFPDNNTLWWVAAILFWLVAFSFVIGRFAERIAPEWLAEPFIKAGSIWLGAMLYLTLLFLLTDIFRGINGLFHISESMRFNWGDTKGKTTILLVYSLSAIILIGGFFSAKIPVVRRLAIDISKTMPEGKQKVVLVSDIHLGTIISTKRLNRMVNLVNEQNADVVLLAGDIFDEDLGPVIQNNLGDLLKNLKARQGVYAILGNHEFYGNADAAQKYMQEHKIMVLRDSVATLKNGISIVGREDITGERMYGKPRKKLGELLLGVNMNNPVFLMDHQPYNFTDVASHKIDLQVSGHTHNGQMWPLNYITRAMFEISKGYGKMKDTHFYVSSGYGTWGPPIRTNSRSEIIVIEISGK